MPQERKNVIGIGINILGTSIKIKLIIRYVSVSLDIDAGTIALMNKIVTGKPHE